MRWNRIVAHLPKNWRPFAVVFLLIAQGAGQGQGIFTFANPTARTHIGSIDGPLAGPEIFARMLAGPTAENLAVIGTGSVPHLTNGLVIGGIVQVPTVPPFGTAYVQMVVWDSRLWGTDLAFVPEQWLGRTDIVPRIVAPPEQGAGPPAFGRSAIVPIPEPGVVGLALVSGTVFICTAYARRRCAGNRPVGNSS